MRKYRSIEGDENNMTTAAVTAPGPRQEFLQYLENYESLVADDDTSFMEQTIDEEYTSYTSSVPKGPGASKLDPIKFWEVSFIIFDRLMKLYNNLLLKTNRETFPTLFMIAMDYLPIQASSVPSERVFSSSAETDTKKRNRINPDLMEALQLLKFAYKKDRLNFTSGLLTSKEEMTLDIAGIDPLAGSADSSSDRVVLDFDSSL